MGLRSFHIVFIVSALAMLAVTVYLLGSRDLALAAPCAAALAVGVPYLGWFLKKTKHIG